MSNIDHLLDRNRVFAGTDALRNVPALPFLPWQSLYIVICIDCRVDPFRGDDIGRRCSGEMP